MENDSNTLHNKALTHRELNLEKYPLSQLVFGLCPQPNNHLSRQNQIIRKHKENYLENWKEATKNMS